MRKQAERMEKCVLAAERRADIAKKERIEAEQSLIDHCLANNRPNMY